MEGIIRHNASDLVLNVRTNYDPSKLNDIVFKIMNNFSSRPIWIKWDHNYVRDGKG